jgi:hypothetical protein
VDDDSCTWKPHGGGPLIDDPIKDMEILMPNRNSRKKYMRGGMAKGPLHSEGGIPGVVGKEKWPIEFEGDEFILNRGATEILGDEFLHNLNNLGLSDRQSTIKPGDLSQFGSNYRNGGGIGNRPGIINKRRRDITGRAGRSVGKRSRKNSYPIARSNANKWNLKQKNGIHSTLANEKLSRDEILLKMNTLENQQCPKGQRLDSHGVCRGLK